jgi:hypothetical protein
MRPLNSLPGKVVECSALIQFDCLPAAAARVRVSFGVDGGGGDGHHAYVLPPPPRILALVMLVYGPCLPSHSSRVLLHPTGMSLKQSRRAFAAIP